MYAIVTKSWNDFCDVCRLNVRQIQRSADLRDKEEECILHDSMEHIGRIKLQRDFYNRRRNEVIEKTSSKIDDKIHMLSFDFAEQMYYSSIPEKFNPIYFKISRNYSILGIYDERTHEQMNFLIEIDDVVIGVNELSA